LTYSVVAWSRKIEDRTAVHKRAQSSEACRRWIGQAEVGEQQATRLKKKKMIKQRGRSQTIQQVLNKSTRRERNKKKRKIEQQMQKMLKMLKMSECGRSRSRSKGR
jgi:hypothetical protein